MRTRLLALALALSPSLALADDATRAAWTELEARKAAAEKILSAAREEAAKTEDKDAKMKILRASWAKSEAEKKPAEEAFRAAFAKSDWKSWDAQRDAALLEEGLTSVAEHAIESDPRTSVAAWELLLERLPNCDSARWVRSTWLPIALPAAGDLDAAEKRLGELRDACEEEAKPELWMAVGDVRALKGDIEGAQKAYAEARALIPDGADPTKDPRGRAKAYVEMRQALIGKPAPEIDSKTWFGGEAKPLSAFKGSVILVDFWATW
jgi:tetratricopeptide (TPR) repeat protein